MKIEPTYVVIDTNVLISAALLPRNQIAELLGLLFDNFVLAQNKFTWDELQSRMLRKKFDAYFGANGRLQFLTIVAQNTVFFEPKAQVNDCRDADDNQFLGLAIDAKAQMIVSGDADLKVLHPYKGIAIYSPSECLNILKQR